MANTVQIKRGNNTSVNAHTGPSGELIYNLDTGRLHAQDGSTAGGNPHALISDVDLKANASVTISAGAGLTGGGTLADNRTLALSSASIASLSLADSAVQPNITITAGAGLSGGGDLTANRTLSLNATSIASLAKADSAIQAPGGTASQVLAKNSNTTNDVVWITSAAATAVSYGPQTLTTAQKTQARTNIDAASSAQGAKADTAVQPYDTVATVESSNIPATVNAIRTNGYHAAGDGGGALYKRVPSEPDHAGKIQSSDGTWWELSGLEINARQLGAKGDGINNDTIPLQNFLNCTIALKVNGKVPSGRWNISAPGLLLDHSSVVGDFTPSIYGEGPLTLFICASGNYTAFETRGYNAPNYGAKLQTIGGFTLYKPTGSDGIGFKSTGFCFGRYERIRTIGFKEGQVYEGTFSCEVEQPYSYGNELNMKFIPGSGDTSDPGGGTYCPNAITITQPYISQGKVGGLYVERPANFSVRGGSIENNGEQGNVSYGVWFNNPGMQGAQGFTLDGVYFEDNAGRADVMISSYENETVNTIRDCNFARISSSRYTVNNILSDLTIDTVLNLDGNGFRGAGSYVSDASRKYVDFTSTSPNYRGFGTNNFKQDVGARHLKRPKFLAVGDAANVVINADNQVLTFPAAVAASDDYNTSTSRFVVPVSGIYQFTVTLGLNGVTTQGSIGFGKNGILDTSSIVRFTGVQPVNLTLVLELVQGDIIDVRSFMGAGGSFDYRGFISSFSGVFIG